MMGSRGGGFHWMISAYARSFSPSSLSSSLLSGSSTIPTRRARSTRICPLNRTWNIWRCIGHGGHCTRPHTRASKVVGRIPIRGTHPGNWGLLSITVPEMNFYQLLWTLSLDRKNYNLARGTEGVLNTQWVYVETLWSIISNDFIPFCLSFRFIAPPRLLPAIEFTADSFWIGLQRRSILTDFLHVKTLWFWSF